MATIIIAKNTTGVALALHHLSSPDGVLPASLVPITLTDFNTVIQIQEDEQLLGYITGGDVILNLNGTDLSLTESENLVTTVASPSDPVFNTTTDTGGGAGNDGYLLKLDTSGELDGRDIGADGLTLDTHVADTANPHGTVVGWVFKGAWNASTNTPALASGVGGSGDAYQVSVAGTTILDGISAWGVGDYVIFDSALNTWERIGGSGSTIYDIQAAPTSPSAFDDEFRDSAVDAAWSLWNPQAATVISVSEDARGLELVCLDDPAFGVSSAGLIRVIPSTDEWEIVAHISLGIDTTPPSNECMAGLLIGADLVGSPDTDPLSGVAFNYDIAGPDGVVGFNQADYNTNFSSTTKQQDWSLVSGYLCLQYKGTTDVIAAWVSQDGLRWTQVRSSSNAGIGVGNAAYMGILVNVYGGQTTRVRSQLFRVTRQAASGIIDTPPAALGGRGAGVASGTLDHAALTTNLSWSTSGHTGTASNLAGFTALGAADNLSGTEATALLDPVTAVLKGVAPASGGGTANFLRADATWAAPPSGSGNIDTAGTLWVAKDGNDGAALPDRQDLPYLTVGAALTAATSGDVVMIRPGTYAESGLTIPAAVKVSGAGWQVTTIGVAGALANIIAIGAGSALSGVTIQCPSGVGLAGVIHTSGTGSILDCNLAGVAAGSGDGIHKSGTQKLIGGLIRCEAGGLNAMLRVSAGVLALDDSHMPQSSNAVAAMVLAEGTGTFQAQGMNCGNSNCTAGIKVAGTATVRVFSPNIFNVTYGLHITADGVTVTVEGGEVSATAATLLVDPLLGGTGTKLTVTGTAIQPLFSFPSVALATMDLAASFHQEATSTRRAESRVVGSDFVTGFPELGSGLMVGEGSAYSDGLKVVTSDSTATSTTLGGNLTDETVAAKSVDGSTFTFQGTAADHCIYFGTTRVAPSGTELKHWGLSLSQVAAGVGGSYAVEIWDGAAWVAIGVMATSQDESYRYANSLCLRALSTEFWSYGIDGSTTWATISVDGTTAYWVRLRVDTTLTTEPTFERTWLVPSHAMINAQGQLAARGLAQWHTSIAASGIQWSGSGLGNGVEAVGTGGGAWSHELDKGLLNSMNDELSLQLLLPRGICTAFPISIRLIYGYHAFVAAPTLEGRSLVVECEGVLVADTGGSPIPVARSEANTDAVDSVAGLIQALNPSTSTTAKIFSLTYGPIDISGHYAGDMVLFNLDMTADGGGTDVLVWAVEIEGVAFSHGDVL